MHDLAIRSVELCAGVGMLGEGVRAAFEFLGYRFQTVCYVEREAAAASQLVALMEAGVFDQAPVWSDMLTFDGRRWRGKVDCLIAGFPCQDLSVAGKRAGLDGKRSGLFFRILDIADDCDADFLILENVSGIASATASVMDEAEGELEERAVARVLGELADRGWDAEYLTLSASDVGASHERERWFCVAWRMANTESERRGEARECSGASIPGTGGTSAELGDSTRINGEQRIGLGISEEATAGREHGAEGSGEGMADPDCTRWPQAGSGHSLDAGKQSESGGGTVADASSAGLEGREQRGTCLSDRGGQKAHGSTSELCGALPFFAPGPKDGRWPAILDERPDLAPATEPGVRLLVDGMALLADESKSHQLRQTGNGVVSLCAATALVVLLRRAGIKKP